MHLTPHNDTFYADLGKVVTVMVCFFFFFHDLCLVIEHLMLIYSAFYLCSWYFIDH